MMRARYAVLFALVLAPSAAGAQPSRPTAHWSGIAPGPHAVGYRRLDLEDPTRTLIADTLPGHPGCTISVGCQRPRPRVLPVRLWYPAAAARASVPMTLWEVIQHDPDLRPTSLHDALRERTIDILRYAARKYAGAGGATIAVGDTAGLAGRAAEMRIASVRNAPHAGEPFPLVVFAGGAYHSTDENIALWEHLASHGYVVASFPSVGVGIGTGAGEADLPDDAMGLETMARDVEFVLAELADSAFVAAPGVVAMGFSFGGAAALVAAARNREIGAVVGLDPSFIARRHHAIIRGAPLFDPRRIEGPVLELHRADTTVDLGIMQEILGGPRYSVELDGLDHVDFNSYVLFYERALREHGRPNAARDSAVAAKAAAYRGMVEGVRRFLHGVRGLEPLPDSTSTAGLFSSAPKGARVKAWKGTRW